MLFDTDIQVMAKHGYRQKIRTKLKDSFVQRTINDFVSESMCSTKVILVA
jgi:hypothetical protein